MSDLIRLRSGGTLPRSVSDYDRSRSGIGRRSLRSFCYAPFLSMDFDAAGNICLCNHSHTSIGNVSRDRVLDVWRGAVYRRYREEMRNYIVDEENCRHCVRQCSAGSSSHVFAVEQFDAWAHDDPDPPYPKRLIFRLRNTCNLACIMCDGITSSRIRKERDHLPPTPSMYDERFFRDMEEILPHVEHIEFYGGEPFLVKEHLRIFEILVRVKSRCTIYVNTNTVSLHAQAKRFLEELNFKTIAVSMDAVHGELHGEIRVGLKSELFFSNIEYLLDLRKRKGLAVMLNVTEHRKNWFELPEVFRFAERKRLYLHINTCIHPHNVTLYTLPTPQLRYVLAYLEEQRSALLAEHPRLSNLANYDFLLSLVRGELGSRTPDWRPELTNLNRASDGLLACPRPGLAPFNAPSAVLREAERIAGMLDPETAGRMLAELRERADRLPDPLAWHPVVTRIEQIATTLPQQRTQDIRGQRVSRAGMKRYHIAGMSGSGKTTLGERLAELGHIVVDTDAVPGLCRWFHLPSRTPVASAPAHPWPREWLEEHQWVWSASRLRELMDQAAEVVFVCGGAHNEEDFVNWFDLQFFLTTDDATIRARLQQREPQRWADDSAELKRVLEWNQLPPTPHANLIVIDATRPPDQVAEEILSHVRANLASG